MKMNVSAPCVVGLVLLSSLLLQGCDFPWSSKAEPDMKSEKKQNQTDEFGAAQCLNKTFSCNGNWRSWCAEQKKRCTGAAPDPEPAGDCTPKCTWECGTAKCDQVCAPKCDKAICTTRCKGFNTNSCSMKCGKPTCKVVCPKHFCPGQQCAACKTECGKPDCQMQCEKGEQNCRNVCTQPRCKWECKAPTECPKPTCAMKCLKPRGCMDNTQLVTQLPPLLPGETEVTSFHTVSSQSPAPAPLAPVVASPAPASLLDVKSLVHTKASTVRVNIATMREDHSLQNRQVDLQLAPMDAITTFTWTKSIRKHNGHVTENDASCEKDGFQCKGDSVWCKEQEAIMDCATLESDQEFVEVVQAAEGAQSETQPIVNVQVASGAWTADAAKGAAREDDVEDDEQEEEESQDAAAQDLNTMGKTSKFLRQRQAHLKA